MPVPDEEFTELVDPDFPRVDLVGKGANGIRGFLIAKSADDEPGSLFGPDYVRSLISKTTASAGGKEDQVTVQGSPAAIAKLINEGAARRREQVAIEKAAAAAYPGDPLEVAVAKALYDAVIKEKYNAADRKRMAGSGAA